MGFFHKKGEIPPPLHGQVQKIEELLIKIMNKSELKVQKGQFSRYTLYICYGGPYPLTHVDCGMSHRSVIEEKGKREKALD